MAQMTSGMVLRQARERKGLDLNTVARRLRIRPDILRAIENGDFSGMPPRGYTRNMVNAYARLVGLNPTEVVNMYLDEVRANQVARAHASSNTRGFSSERSNRTEHHRTSFTDLDGEADDRSRTHRDSADHDHKRSLFTRDLYDDRTPFSRDDYGLMRDSAKRKDNSSRDFQSHHSGYDSNESSGFSLPSFPFSIGGGGSSRSSRRTSTSNVGYSREDYRGNASRFSSFGGNRSLIIAIALIALVILIIVLAVTISNRNAAARSEVSTLPVSGIADTTSGDSGSTVTVAAPTSVAVTYTASGSASVYLQTYTNGVQSNETLSAGSSQTVAVTGTWSIATWTPTNLTVTVDGKQVELTSNATFGNMYAYTVDFKTYLEQWGASHNQEVDTSNITSTVDASGNDTLSVTSGPQPTTSSSSASSASSSSSSAAARSSSSSTTSTGTTGTTTGTTSTGTTSTGSTTGSTTSTNTTTTTTTTR